MNLLVTLVVVVGLAFLGFQSLETKEFAFTDDGSIAVPVESVIREEVRASATEADVQSQIDAAIARNDVETADMMVEIARFAGFAVAPKTLERLGKAHGQVETLMRGTGDFLSGFATGEADNATKLAGAVAADLTVIGDVRDIALQGPRFVAGEPYDELILGLSVIGVAATGATVATGGGGVPAKIGVSVLKAAKRAGTLTLDFAKTLGRLVGDAIDTPGLKQTLRTTDFGDIKAVTRAIDIHAGAIKRSEIVPVLARFDDLRTNAGTGQTVQLLRYVKTTENLEDLADMSKFTGKKTRGIVEITGKASLRAFKTTFTLIEFAIANLISFIAWLFGLLILLFHRAVSSSAPRQRRIFG